jgi:hypothetical protein
LYKDNKNILTDVILARNTKNKTQLVHFPGREDPKNGFSQNIIFREGGGAFTLQDLCTKKYFSFRIENDCGFFGLKKLGRIGEGVKILHLYTDGKSGMVDC